MITVTIDGREIRTEAGKTILEVARANGIHIPTLCFLEGLLPIGACRLCIVEIDGYDQPQPSCVQVVTDGMNIRTDTDNLRQMRRDILKLLLLEHPLDCPICDKAGECTLQDLVYELGYDTKIVEGAAGVPMLHKPPEAWSTIGIKYFPSRCVVCQRCVHVCLEKVGQGVLEVNKDGSVPRIVPSHPEKCISCGECLAVCPVGALTEDVSALKARPWEKTKTRTVCPYCGVGCNLELNVASDQVIKVTVDETVPPNYGVLCAKGRFGFEFINSEKRLQKPLVRNGNSFKEVSWDEALNYVAKKLKEIKDQYGSSAIAGLCSARCTNEDNYIFQKFMRAVIGTNNVDHCARLCHASTVAGLATTLGSGAMTNSIEDIEDAEVVLVIGSNTTENHPVFGMKLKKLARMKGTKIVVIDPRRIDLVDDAVMHLPLRAGTDIALVNAMLNVIIREELYDKKFVEEHTEGFEELVKVVESYTPERAEEITGVPKEDIIEVARTYARAQRAAIVYCMGVTQHTKGTDNVKSLSNLALVCGHIGKPGTGVNPLRGQNNVQGACDMGGLPVFYPGYQRVDVEDVKRKFEKLWNVKQLSTEPGLTVVEMGHAALEGKIKALYIMGENPILTDPDLHHLEEALEKLELLIVQDIFFTDTCKFAHVVLPSSSFAEKDGTFTNTERRVQRVRKALKPKGDVKDDWRIIAELSERLGYPMPYRNTEEIFEEIRKATPQYAGITYRRIEKVGIQWPCPTEDHPGTPILHVGKIARGKGLLVPVEYKPPKEQPDREYPFVLVTGRNYYQYHTGTMSRKCKVLNYGAPEPVLEMHPMDAHVLGVSPDDIVKLTSRRGSIELKVRVSERVKRGEVFSTFHFSEARVNILTGSELDPVAKIPELKVTAVRIEKVGKGE
ncbi:MAG: formate dehydrogenase subunit alpha [Thermodesulforhabdaceae bacterium]